MSVYQLNKLCYDLKLAANRDAYQQDPDEYIRRYRLDEDERAALDARDYAWLFDHGVNFLVLSTFAGQNGVGGLPQMMDVMREQYAARPPAAAYQLATLDARLAQRVTGADR